MVVIKKSRIYVMRYLSIIVRSSYSCCYSWVRAFIFEGGIKIDGKQLEQSAKRESTVAFMILKMGPMFYHETAVQAYRMRIL
ncbi:hypothetical protein [Clostridium sp.]